MNERPETFHPEKPALTAKDYREQFDLLAREVSFHQAWHLRRNEDGTTTRLTTYQCYATEESVKRTAALRVLGFLAGMKEALPPFVVGPFMGSPDQFPSYSFIHLAYEEASPAAGDSR